jgi:argininosuccinate synthase
MTHRILLACSGSLDAAAAIPRLAAEYDADVVALTLDFGQGQDLEEVRDRALAAGAVRAHVLDVRDELAREYIFPALRAGSLVAERCPLLAALERPLVARKLVEVAGIEHAAIVAHGGDRAGAEQIGRNVHALDPGIRVVALESARGAGTASGPRPVHASAPGRPRLEPDTPASAAIAFEQGVPVAVNDVPMSGPELIESLGIIAGRQGAGARDDREPAAVVLHAAHEALEAHALPQDVRDLKRQFAATYAGLLRDGLWFTSTREAIDAFNIAAPHSVTGVVRVQLVGGQLTVVVPTSPELVAGAVGGS